jgi:hypothetical protein
MLQLLAGAVVKPQGFIPPCLADIKNQTTFAISGAGTTINYGHNIEASWLLQHTMEETGACVGLGWAGLGQGWLGYQADPNCAPKRRDS